MLQINYLNSEQKIGLKLMMTLQLQVNQKILAA